jgi:hypothetical protein
MVDAKWYSPKRSYRLASGIQFLTVYPVPHSRTAFGDLTGTNSGVWTGFFFGQTVVGSDIGSHERQAKKHSS